MPNMCSAFGCKTNYRGHPSASVFRLPKGPQELKNKWIRALHRDIAGDLTENNTFTCTNHFREEDIMRVDRILQADGNYTETPRIRPTCSPNAVPVIFLGFPSHFTSTAQTSKRFSRETKEEEDYYAKGLQAPPSEYLIASFIRFISHSKLEDNIGKFGFILIRIEFNRASSFLILSC